MNKLIIAGSKRPVVNYNVGSYWSSPKSGKHYILVDWSMAGYAAVNIENGALWGHPNPSAKEAVDGLDFIGDVEITLKY